MTATRCISAGSMPALGCNAHVGCRRAHRARSSCRRRPNRSGPRVHWLRPRARPADRRRSSTQSRTTAKAGSAATTAPKPTRLATLNAGSTEALAPASMLSRNAGNRRRLTATTTTMAAASATATDQTPATADKRRRAPSLLRQEREVETRQNDQRHQEIDADDDDQRQHGQSDGRRRVAVMAVADLGGIELACGRRALADDLDRRRRRSGCRVSAPIALARPRAAASARRATTGRSRA